VDAWGSADGKTQTQAVLNALSQFDTDASGADAAAVEGPDSTALQKAAAAALDSPPPGPAAVSYASAMSFLESVAADAQSGSLTAATTTISTAEAQLEKATKEITSCWAGSDWLLPGRAQALEIAVDVYSDEITALADQNRVNVILIARPGAARRHHSPTGPRRQSWSDRHRRGRPGPGGTDERGHEPAQPVTAAELEPEEAQDDAAEAEAGAEPDGPGSSSLSKRHSGG
jgi:hypothetical protein